MILHLKIINHTNQLKHHYQINMTKETKFKVGDKAIKVKGYKFPCTIVSVFETVEGNVRVVGEMDDYGLLHIFNEDQLEKVD